MALFLNEKGCEKMGAGMVMLAMVLASCALIVSNMERKKAEKKNAS